MSRDFDGSTDFIDHGGPSALNAASSFTVACRVNLDSVAGTIHLFNRGQGGGGTGWGLGYESTLNFVKLGVVSIAGTFTLSTGAWFAVGAVITATNVRFFKHDGTTFSGENVADSNPISSHSSGGYIGAIPPTAFGAVNGRVAEVAKWDAALTDAELSAYGLGYSPAMINPGSLKFHAPLVRSLNERFGVSLTATGTSVDVHPRVLQPKRKQAWHVAAAAGGGQPPRSMHQFRVRRAA